MALQEADYGMTDMALGNNPRHAGDSHLWVQFHVLPMVDQDRSAHEGRPIYRDVEHVRILTPGNKDSIVDRPVTEMDKARFRTQYEQWHTNQKDTIEGTMLETWPSLTRSQCEELKHFNIRTVEQLAEVADSLVQKFMGLQTLKAQAKAYIEAAKKNAGTTKLMKELETRDNQIATLQQTVASMQEQLKATLESKKAVVSK